MHVDSTALSVLAVYTTDFRQMECRCTVFRLFTGFSVQIQNKYVLSLPLVQKEGLELT